MSTKPRGKSPHRRMAEAGITIEHHSTDLYVPATEHVYELLADLKADGWPIHDSRFKSYNGTWWIELPFCYEGERS